MRGKERLKRRGRRERKEAREKEGRKEGKQGRRKGGDRWISVLTSSHISIS